MKPFYIKKKEGFPVRWIANSGNLWIVADTEESARSQIISKIKKQEDEEKKQVRRKKYGYK